MWNMKVKWESRNLARFSVCLLIFNGGTGRMESSTEIPQRNNFYIIRDSETLLSASPHFTSERVHRAQESKEWLLLTETMGTGPMRRVYCIALLTSFCHHRRQSEKVLKTPSGLFRVPPGGWARESISQLCSVLEQDWERCVPPWTLRTSRLPCFPEILFLPTDMVPSFFFVSGWCDPVCGNIALPQKEKKHVQPQWNHISRRLITRRQWG